METYTSVDLELGNMQLLIHILVVVLKRGSRTINKDVPRYSSPIVGLVGDVPKDSPAQVKQTVKKLL